MGTPVFRLTPVDGHVQALLYEVQVSLAVRA